MKISKQPWIGFTALAPNLDMSRMKKEIVKGLEMDGNFIIYITERSEKSLRIFLENFEKNLYEAIWYSG